MQLLLVSKKRRCVVLFLWNFKCSIVCWENMETTAVFYVPLFPETKLFFEKAMFVFLNAVSYTYTHTKTTQNNQKNQQLGNSKQSENAENI